MFNPLLDPGVLEMLYNVRHDHRYHEYRIVDGWPHCFHGNSRFLTELDDDEAEEAAKAISVCINKYFDSVGAPGFTDFGVEVYYEDCATFAGSYEGFPRDRSVFIDAVIPELFTPDLYAYLHRSFFRSFPA